MLASKFVCSVLKVAVVALGPSSVKTFVVPLTRAPETVRFTAVIVPVCAGLASGASNNKSEVLALLFKLVNKFVVPLMSEPDTVRLMAVAEPVNAGLINEAFFNNSASM